MTADRWTQVVRHQLGLGRILPLGLPRDGAWITEDAAESALRRETAAVHGVLLGALRIAPADPEWTGTPAVPPPPSALPPGPLRVTAEFRASVDPTSPGVEPLPAVAARLRLTLATAATQRLGLDVAEVDLQVTDLLEEGDASAARPADEARKVSADGPADDVREASADAAADDVRRAPVPKDPEEARIAATVLAVPGVTRLTGALGRPVHIGTAPAPEPALPRRHIRVELAVSPDERAVDVARAVRTAITRAAGDTPSVAVLVTAVSRDVHV
ncbi:nucleopolyhedrovirus P10 family protein [Streptomyces sp. NBC_00568]|uniref:nucleopolyhedrovirus P10 family protein n=1 Tax=Streptomyces sp. NBC_00568 TaxID=2975779 RepID=UPI00224CF3DF|nr:nucleopolyhedrovirus P10 family protein [Streptomyces sp. NBC_00568]MCX4991846.1 nucleopolyhedrovirus P10 family protein [Streptomyces sp. NBC_00568]